MVVDRSFIASLNFGYLTGSDLLQYCPDQHLIKAYSLDPNKLQNGVEDAYATLRAKLINRYDITQIVSNANQSFFNQTSNFTISIAANTYVSQFSFTSTAPTWDVISLTGFPVGEFPIIDVYPTITIGTTPNGNDVLKQTSIGESYFWLANKYFASATTLYVTITGPQVSLVLSATTGVSMPPITYVSFFNQSAAFEIVVPANTYLYQIFSYVLLGAPSIEIGTTLGGNDVLALTLVNNTTTILNTYYASQTTLYVGVFGGSINMIVNEGLNFTAPQPAAYQFKEPVLTCVLAKLALTSILGYMADFGERLTKMFDENEETIKQLQNGMMALSLPNLPENVDATPKIAYSSFKTIG
jgi:hypothetical protein